jgi:hypothetical protein
MLSFIALRQLESDSNFVCNRTQITAAMAANAAETQRVLESDRALQQSMQARSLVHFLFVKLSCSCCFLRLLCVLRWGSGRCELCCDGSGWRSAVRVIELLALTSAHSIARLSLVFAGSAGHAGRARGGHRAADGQERGRGCRCRYVTLCAGFGL